MDVETFWEHMKQAQSPSALHKRLAALPESDLADFENHHHRAMSAGYNWGLWGAAYIINGGCGDDTFEDFRAYLLSRGRAVYEFAIADPDTLAFVEIADSERWEDWASPTMAVVHARTGEYKFVCEPDPGERRPDQPLGREWDEDDLRALFPRLTTKYPW